MKEEIETELDKIEHYQKFEIMKPFIGENYFNAKKRILLVAESHFFASQSNINSGPTKWYSSTLKDLHESKYDNINTRKIVENSAHMVFRELETVLSKSVDKYKNRALNNIAFINAFQRPANKTGQSMKALASSFDFEVGIKTLTKVIEILKPNLVVFISKYAWDNIGKQLPRVENTVYEFVNHPASVKYWHNSKYINSKYKLIKLLQ
ncbi:MAG: hypothetical protein JWP69_997 [Flaviaesturariibacter sp.]|nr:hypothetical protein [Flaviaesturariibacter sp.]